MKYSVHIWGSLPVTVKRFQMVETITDL